MPEKETRTPEEIRADIEATREEVGDTVEALAAKTDVKARAHDRVEEVKADVRSKADELKAKVSDAAPGGGSDAAPGTEPSAGDKAREGVQQATARAKANPLPLAVAGALVLGYLIGRRRAA